MASPASNRNPHHYSFMSEDNDAGTNITVATGGTFYGWVTATGGPEDGITFSSDATADRLTVSSTGTYRVMANASYSANNSAQTKGAVFVSGVENGNLQWHRTMGAAASVGSAGCNGNIDLTANQYIDLRFTSNTNGHVIVLNHVQVSISKIGN